MPETMHHVMAAFLTCTVIAGGLEIAAARQLPPTNETACLSNLKQVTTAVLMYAQDYDERLPPMQTMEATERVIDPYVKNRKVFKCPATAQTYKTNPALGGQLLAAVARPSRAVLFFDAAPHTDRRYSVACLDGLVQREAKVPSLAVKFLAAKVPSHAKKPRVRR